MGADLVVAIIGGLFGVGGAVLAGWTSRRAQEAQRSASRDLEEARLRLDEERQLRAEQRSVQARQQDVQRRYGNPLLWAAFELQSRLYNIVAMNFLGRFRREGSSHFDYAMENSLFVVAQYLCWVEIIRRQVQFLSGDAPGTLDLSEAIERITILFNRSEPADPLMLFRGHQRAIGEKMIVPGMDVEGAGRSDSMGYAAFVQRLRDDDFSTWFDSLRADIDLLARPEHSGLPLHQHYRRLRLLQNALVDLVDLLEQGQPRRLPVEARTKLPLAEFDPVPARYREDLGGVGGETVGP